MTGWHATLLPALFVAAIATPVDARAARVVADHLDIELVSEQLAFVPGTHAALGLRLRHAPQWHSYWTNPGDSGLPTRLAWQLPAGWKAGDIEWPAPRRFEVGGLYNFGHDGEVLLPVSVEVPADERVGGTVTLAVEARWLVCRDECIPGKATLDITRPLARNAAPDAGATQDFAAARAARPREVDWRATARVDGERIAIEVHGVDFADGAMPDVFAVQRRVLGNAPALLRRAGDVLLIDAPKSDVFDEPPPTFDLVLTNGRAGAVQVRVRFPMSSAARSPSA